MKELSLFISSSRKGLPLTSILAAQLQDVGDVKLWTEDFFPNKTAFESLFDIANSVDYAIFVLTGDDIDNLKSNSLQANRNVIFEIGFFLGVLGSSRTFIVNADPDKLLLPSNLNGIIQFSLSHEGLALPIRNVADFIRKKIQEFSPREKKRIDYYSCFISYSHSDSNFAQQIHNNLKEVGVNCWLDEKELQTGYHWFPQIEKAIQSHDKILLILSQASVTSPWVRTEIRNALRLERDRHKTILFPIRTDDAVFRITDFPEMNDLREKQIGDFSDWRNSVKYRQAFARLVRDLAISTSVDSGGKS